MTETAMVVKPIDPSKTYRVGVINHLGENGVCWCNLHREPSNTRAIMATSAKTTTSIQRKSTTILNDVVAKTTI